jgi:hypothetical protein
MAAFASISAAEVRLRAKGPAGDRTWVNGHVGRTVTGVICVRVQRYMSSASDATRSAGAWVEITDDAVV